MSKMVLQIYKGDVPLTLVEVGRIIHGLKDEEIHETANAILTDEAKKLPRRCDNKDHHHYKKCVGGGICLAKKYKRLFASVDLTCVSCESKAITDTLNYIFDRYYNGEYRAEWRQTRRNKSYAPPKKSKPKKQVEEEIRPEPIVVEKVEVTPVPEVKLSAGIIPRTPRRIPGRQGRVMRVEA